MEMKAAASSPPPPSNSESQNSATQPIQPKREVDDAPTTNNSGAFDVFDQKPVTKPPLTPEHFQILKNADYMEKFQKYEADYTHRLMAKYFSKNNIYGGNVFDDKTTIDDKTIMSSRWPCIQTFADPMQGYEDQNISGSTSTVETRNNISNGKHTPKKNNSWGMVSRLDDDPLLKIETALVNASTCQDLLSPTNLRGSCLVDVVAGMDNKILGAMLRKRARVSGDFSSAPSPQKKSNVGPPKALVLALPPPTRKDGGEKPRDKSPEGSAPSKDRTLSPPPRDRGDHLVPYQNDYIKSVGPKMVKDIESMDLGELGGSLQRVAFKLATLASCYKHRIVRHERKQQVEIQDLKKKVESADRSKEKMLDLHRQVMDLKEKVVIAESKTSKLESELADLKSDFEATQSERDTQKTAYEEQIKSLDKQVAELKGKAADVDDRLDAKYDSGLTFCYKCIMFVLKKEYPELNMNKLETGVREYMVEQGQGDKNQGEVPRSGE